MAEASSRALLEPHWSAAALRQRFDDVLGTEGWSYQLTPVGERAIICNLTIDASSRAAVAEVRLARGDGAEQLPTPAVSITALAELALARAAAQFGIAPVLDADVDSYWVDFDPEAGEALFLPQAVLLVPKHEAIPPSGEQDRPLEQPVGQQPSGERPEAEGEPQAAASEGQAVIQRLIDRLNAEGLGREAAKLVVEYHGYGRTPEEARELYGRLRALLVGQDATS